MVDTYVPTRSRSAVATHPLVRSTAAVVLTTGVTSALGYVYWALAARIFPVSGLGQGSALIAASATVALIGAQAFTIPVLRGLPSDSRAKSRSALVVVAASAAATVTLALAALAIVVLPLLSTTYETLRHPPTEAAFAIAAVATGAGFVLDAAAIALRVGQVMTARNTLMSLLKLGALAGVYLPFARHVVHGSGPLVISVSWAAGALTSIAWELWRLRRAAPLTILRDRPATRGALTTLRAGVTWQYLGVLGGSLPPQLLPLVVGMRSTSSEVGYFTLTWLLGSLCLMLSPAVATALLAEGSSVPAQLRAKVIQTLRWTLVLLIPVSVALLVGGKALLGIFGPGYPEAGYGLLAVLALSAIPDCLTNIAVAALRARNELRTVGAINGTIGVTAVVGAWVLVPVQGIVGVGEAWLSAQCLGCLVAAFAIRQRRRRPA